jgi:hypothetical protein
MGSGGHPGHGSRSSMEPGTSAKAMEHDRFARSLAALSNAGPDQQIIRLVD